MNYRYIYENKISNLCFGSSMFVSGKIRPNANSEVGKMALLSSLNRGVNIIHSNFNVKTSWAIRKVIQMISLDKPPFHLIKIEMSLISNIAQLRDLFIEKLVNSVNELETDSVFAIMYEIDNKRTPIELYNSDKLIFQNFDSIKQIFDEIKLKYDVKYLFHNAKTEREILLSLEFGKFDGYSSYFNLVDIWIVPHLDNIYRTGKVYLAMAPYKKGELVEHKFYNSEYNIDAINRKISMLNEIGFDTFPLQKFILQYVLAHPVVKTVIIGITKPDYLGEIIEASNMPFSLSEFNKISEVLSL